MVTDNPLICYCGKATRIYDSLFRRNFCSDECSTALRLFLGGTDKTIEIMKEIRAGDFKIRGPVVTFSDTLKAHQAMKVDRIDAIDAQVRAKLIEDKQRSELIKIGLPTHTIDAILAAQKDEQKDKS